MSIVSTPHNSNTDSRFSNWSGINDNFSIDYNKVFSSNFDISSSLFLNIYVCIRPSGKYFNWKYSFWPFNIIEQLINLFIIDSSTTTTVSKESIIEKKITLISNILQVEDAFTNAINKDFSQNASHKD